MPRVLCAFDASEPSLLAAHAAAWLTRAFDAHLELVYVVDHGALPALPPRGAGIDPDVRDALPLIQEQIAEDAAGAELGATLAGLPHTNVTGTVLTGSPAAALRRHAVETHALLVVAGAASRHGLQRVLHGSVSGALAADAPCPVMIVPMHAALRAPGPVLVADDGSVHAARAARHAEALAERLGRPLERVHAEHGDPAETIARTAHDQRACLIVAGTRGRGPLREQLFGSVTTELVRIAARPVVLVSEHAGD